LPGQVVATFFNGIPTLLEGELTTEVSAHG